MNHDFQEQAFMMRALLLSHQSLPACRPNPPVGCVLVKDGEIVSEGFTQPPGQHHAEAMALANYHGSFTNVTAYVTLEPCSFVGRTPSCAHTLVELGVKKVVVATLDPDSRNSGKGIAVLKEAGIEVEVGLCENEVLDFIEPYLIKN
ncbi:MULTISPECIES: bifunctional diaminohydroxyphosphoribosylaminopyrimidine deaminase/5-amino-6-(5-phosphoribosylamino)uracil reductase RibD [unclassified Photobacterium]|uniref:bifunctional diaminohydroxyphosphoribosylaminopyrimidine deaminase/5-amino-6-(5-phosphoribosylamino)uracil reductase RibD n=1 Tax=unclassified Photobacterium TaxID=2628852 RepID=UPI001EE05DAE|nr:MULTISPECIES: bifunctional diaminohydroxyphosphoribosylaminopyrimidine deaminase/5-amino-6-(5-phosphoribosylamino)uracil reductase RibD [unclassified Photobacterium]MCG3863541.1 bifunctional diaminohydroxyphosphoribosylaminopyrimidine deaminase/5-amino-6-(5-phosphoribosylamino)uracil reductase RibD [Photobacterium sp. Ph6]MCG3875070.1 bifunctional diaminohydroxyphosphoribosylaminopyrimidine deaminase/5-amino-6-(5-phosphoribosylamino)uracil reductase RibD [Photobacterium sp. Ph5]